MDGDTTTAKSLILPKAAQEGIMEGLGKAIEALSALLDLAKGAQVSEDAAAAVPPEYAEQVERIGMMIAALGDQYDGGGALPADPGAPALAPEEMVLAKEVAKSIAANIVKMGAHVSKGKLKMSFDQAMKVHHGLMMKLFSIASEMAPLLSELGGGDLADALGPKPEGAADPPAPPPDPTAKALTPPAPPVVAAPPTTTPETTTALERLAKSVEALGGLVSRIAKTRPAPNGAPNAREGGEPAPTERIQYGVNLSKVVAEEAAKAAASGA